MTPHRVREDRQSHKVFATQIFSCEVYVTKPSSPIHALGVFDCIGAFVDRAWRRLVFTEHRRETFVSNKFPGLDLSFIPRERLERHKPSLRIRSLLKPY